MTPELLKRLVIYDPSTGDMKWLCRDEVLFKNNNAFKGWNKRYVGQSAVTLDGKGYLVVSIFKKRFLVHRLAWMYVHGRFPAVAIDHRNGVKTDNRLVNLRECTNQQNNMNRGRATNNTSGVTGVYLNRKSNIWCAQMKLNGFTYHLGSSKNFDVAVSMRKDEEARLGFSDRHGQ